MAIKAVLFDLDGPLLPMDQERFTEIYFTNLAIKAAPLGYEPKSLVKHIWAGTAAMVKNDGSRINEQAFWDTFCGIYGPDAINHKPIFDEFYSNEFCKAKEACGFAPEADKVIKLLKAKGKGVVLATNPLFPSVATRNRASWAGLSISDFLLYTTYENSCYCKPNPKYYIEICEKLKLDPKECLMVGNDVTEDMVAETLGMKVFLLTDCIINKKNKDISAYPHGGFKELKQFIETEL